VLPELEGLILDCLAKDRERRPDDARVAHDRLLRCAALAPWSQTDAVDFWRAFRAEAPGASAVRSSSGQVSEVGPAAG
jgi:hypothetical protein